jgi:hypothetical protein
MTGGPHRTWNGRGADAPRMSGTTQTGPKFDGQIGRSGPKRGQKLKWVAPLGWAICPRGHERTAFVRLGWAAGDALNLEDGSAVRWR